MPKLFKTLRKELDGYKRSPDERAFIDMHTVDLVDYPLENNGVYEETMTKAQITKRDEIADAIIKDSKEDMKERYGNDWKNVAYAIATKQVMKEEVDLDEATDFKKMKDDQLLKWIRKNDSDEPGMSPAFGAQLKSARKEAIKRKLKINEKLDPVGKSDDDVDNDGDVDDSDKYLKNRRKAISRAMNEGAKTHFVYQKGVPKTKEVVHRGDEKSSKEWIEKNAKFYGHKGRDFDIYKGKYPNVSPKDRVDFRYIAEEEDVDLTEVFKAGRFVLDDGSKMNLSNQDAKLLNDMLKDLNPNNRRRMEKVLKTDEAGFEEILGFAREAL